MKTKKILQLIMYSSLVLLAPAKIFAQNLPAQMSFHVIDDSSNPISGLGFGLGSWVSPAWNVMATGTNSFGTTDSKGNVTLSVLSENGIMGYGSKYGTPGFYGTHCEYQFKTTNGGKWQPWNPTVDVVVKPILNPIAMYAQAVRLTLPAKNTPVGFDLEAGDLVAPYGKGITSDFIFTLNEKVPFVSGNQPYDITNTLSFSNKGDGIQSVIGSPLNQGSTLRLPRFAPEDGYQPTLPQELSLVGNKRLNGADNETQNYFFRVRTVLDESGKVKSTLYGKISGPLICGPQGYLQFTYYLNPTANDRNMEFDPKKNLFKNLSDLQQVNAP